MEAAAFPAGPRRRAAVGMVREAVKKAGGKWEPEKKLWRMRLDRALKLGLKERIRPYPTRKSLYL